MGSQEESQWGKQRAAQQDSYHPPARCDSLISAGLSSPLFQHPTIIPHSSFNPGFYSPPFSCVLLSGNQRKAPASVEWREGKKNRAGETVKAKTNKENISYLRLRKCSKRWEENSSLRFVFPTELRLTTANCAATRAVLKTSRYY